LLLVETDKPCFGSKKAEEKRFLYDDFATQLAVWMLPSEDDFPYYPGAPLRFR